MIGYCPDSDVTHIQGRSNLRSPSSADSIVEFHSHHALGNQPDGSRWISDNASVFDLDDCQSAKEETTSRP